MHPLLLALPLALAVAGAPAFAAAGPMSPAERGAATRAFVKKWGPYVQHVEGIPARTWAMRMVPTFTAADPDNLRRALERDTLEGALAELVGRGQRLDDEDVIDARAAEGVPSARKVQEAAIQALGSTTSDLVYTAVTPCRVVDTRVAGGVIAANSSRNFVVVSISSGTGFAFQGGSSTDCNVAAIGASAVALNVTAVQPANVGFATVWKSGETRPLAAAITYNAGQLISNLVVTGIPNPLGLTDVSLYSSAQSHYVVDIVGYFSPPQATSFDCTSTSVQSFTINAGTINFFNNPTCPAGYRATTPYCWTASGGVYSQGSGYNANAAGNATFCSWQNTTASNQTVFGGNVCCRVPGK